MSPTDLFSQTFMDLKQQEPDLYRFLNTLRDWTNRTMANYEIILEDEWYPEQTTIEYILRCLDTFNLFTFAKDVYQNRQDAKGVWHLGDYVTTQWVVNQPLDQLLQFVGENTPMLAKDAAQSHKGT